MSETARRQRPRNKDFVGLCAGFSHQVEYEDGRPTRLIVLDRRGRTLLRLEATDGATNLVKMEDRSCGE